VYVDTEEHNLNILTSGQDSQTLWGNLMGKYNSKCRSHINPTNQRGKCCVCP